MKIKTIVYALCLGGCIGLALTFSLLAVSSWSGGSDGIVILRFNQFHERLIETIIFPIWTIGGFIASYNLFKRGI